MKRSRAAVRWAGSSLFVRFQTVGLLGAGIHLGVLWLARSCLGLHYLLATVLAVESALLHNFVWHLSWTWADRPSAGLGDVLGRVGRFHCANGLVSVAGNLLLMRIFTGGLGIPPLAAGGLSIGICSLLNFLLGDRFVFRGQPSPEAGN